MWWRIAAVALAFALSTALTWPASSSPPRITETAQRPVTIATLPCETQLQSTSSGFVIDDELVLTVAHAIYDSRDYAVRDSTGRWHDAQVQFMDLERDLAVLRIPSLAASPMSLQPANRGDQVRMLEGAASGTASGQVLRRVRISTQVIGDREQDSQRSGYELSVEIKGGDSGSAIVDNADRLAGVVFARSTRRDASWATSVTELAGITAQRGAPDWACDRPSDLQLIREPLAEPTRLAN